MSNPASGRWPTPCAPTPASKPPNTPPPVLGLIFLKYADQRFREARTRLETQYSGETFTRDDFQAEGVLYLRNSARYDALLHLPESADIGQAVNDAMRAIEEDNDDLRDTLPKDYRRIANSTLVSPPF